MKLNDIFKSALLGASTLLMAGCADDGISPDGSWNGEVPDEVRLTLVISDPEIVKLSGTRAESDWTLEALIYGDDGNSDNALLNHVKLDNFEYDASTGMIKVTTPLLPAARNLVVVANGNLDDADPEPSHNWVKGAQTNPVLWGSASIEDAVVKSTVMLIRNTARVSVMLGEGVDNFEIGEFGVFGVAAEGSVGPDGSLIPAGKHLPDAPTLKQEAAYTATTGMTAWSDSGDNSAEGIYETPQSYKNNGKDDFSRIIIKGTYTDGNGRRTEGYYVARFATRAEADDDGYSETPGHYSYSPVDVLRNRDYHLEIEEVRAAGWTTLEQAKVALPDNRLTVRLDVDDNDVSDVISTRDYFLGVAGEVVAGWEGDGLNENGESTGKAVTVKIMTNYAGILGGARYSLSTSDPWIHLEVANASAPKEGEGPSTVSDEVAINLDSHADDTEPRFGTITVTAGKLTRTITVQQKGRAYRREFPISLSGLKEGEDMTPVAEIADYFKWLDADVRGISKEANRGLTRNNGLHFPAVPLYTDITYTIPVSHNGITITKAAITSGGDDFTLTGNTTSGWTVTLPADKKSTPHLATGKLVLTMQIEGNTVDVEYDLYRTGIIHRLTDESTQYQATWRDVQRTGWYYYEVVKVGNTIILDRDLGASSNEAYAPGAGEYRRNTDAIGGYFRANTGKWDAAPENDFDKQTITARLGLKPDPSKNGGFVMATEDDVESWHLDTSGRAISAAISKGYVTDGQIYFPRAGYYENSEPKGEDHAQFWTRRYLGGTQGLARNSAEYGYWYRVVDASTGYKFTNFRLFRGADGQTATPYSVWRYMPLRLVWVDDNSDNIDTSQSSSQGNVVSGKLVIYMFNEIGWARPDLYYWAFDDMPTMNYQNDSNPMAKVSGEDNLWRMELTVPKDGSGIIFRSGKNAGGGYQTGDINVYNEYRAGHTVLYYRVYKDGISVKYELTEKSNLDRSDSGGDTPTPPTPGGSTKIYCWNLENWDTVKVTCQVSKGSGSNENTTYTMTKEHDWYPEVWSVTVPNSKEEINKIGFTGGGVTNPPAWINVDNDDVYYNNYDSQINTPRLSEVPAPASGVRRVGFKDTGNWGTVNAHIWNNDGPETSWPGKAATKLTSKFWYYDIKDNKYTKIKFNQKDGGSQGAGDCNIVDGRLYDASSKD